MSVRCRSSEDPPPSRRHPLPPAISTSPSRHHRSSLAVAVALRLTPAFALSPSTFPLRIALPGQATRLMRQSPHRRPRRLMVPSSCTQPTPPPPPPPPDLPERDHPATSSMSEVASPPVLSPKQFDSPMTSQHVQHNSRPSPTSVVPAAFALLCQLSLAVVAVAVSLAARRLTVAALLAGLSIPPLLSVVRRLFSTLRQPPEPDLATPFKSPPSSPTSPASSSEVQSAPLSPSKLASPNAEKPSDATPQLTTILDSLLVPHFTNLHTSISSLRTAADNSNSSSGTPPRGSNPTQQRALLSSLRVVEQTLSLVQAARDAHAITISRLRAAEADLARRSADTTALLQLRREKAAADERAAEADNLRARVATAETRVAALESELLTATRETERARISADEARAAATAASATADAARQAAVIAKEQQQQQEQLFQQQRQELLVLQQEKQLQQQEEQTRRENAGPLDRLRDSVAELARRDGGAGERSIRLEEQAYWQGRLRGGNSLNADSVVLDELARTQQQPVVPPTDPLGSARAATPVAQADVGLSADGGFGAPASAPKKGVVPSLKPTSIATNFRTEATAATVTALSAPVGSGKPIVGTDDEEGTDTAFAFSRDEFSPEPDAGAVDINDSPSLATLSAPQLDSPSQKSSSQPGNTLQGKEETKEDDHQFIQGVEVDMDTDNVEKEESDYTKVVEEVVEEIIEEVGKDGVEAQHKTQESASYLDSLSTPPQPRRGVRAPLLETDRKARRESDASFVTAVSPNGNAMSDSPRTPEETSQAQPDEVATAPMANASEEEDDKRERDVEECKASSPEQNTLQEGTAMVDEQPQTFHSRGQAEGAEEGQRAEGVENDVGARTSEPSIRATIEEARELVRRGRQWGQSVAEASSAFERSEAVLRRALLRATAQSVSNGGGKGSTDATVDEVQGELGSCLVTWAKLDMGATGAQRRLADGLALLELRVRANGRDATALFNIGLCLCLQAAMAAERRDAQRLYGRAVQTYDRLLDVEDSSRIAMFNAGLACVSLARTMQAEGEAASEWTPLLRKAAKRFERTLEMRPADAKAESYLHDCQTQLAEAEALEATNSGLAVEHTTENNEDEGPEPGSESDADEQSGPNRTG